MMQKQKILIIQTAFIGDIALSIFFANDIKQIFPNSEITFISTKVGYEVLNCFKIISNIIPYDKHNSEKNISDIFKLAKKINQNEHQFDIIFALHRSFRTAILTKLINSKLKIGFNKNSLSFLLDKKITYCKNLHEIEKNRKCLEIFDNFKNYSFDYLTAISTIKNSFCITANDISDISNLLHNDKKYIVVAPGSVWETKRWNSEYFIKLCKSLIKYDCKVYLIGSHNEIELCNKIATSSGTISIAGKTTIPQILEIIKNAKLVISNDSAPTHFASLMNIPTITIFGPTIPNFGFYPLSEKSISIESQNLHCRPCSIHGTKKCPKKHFKCMKNIKPEHILQNIKL